MSEEKCPRCGGTEFREYDRGPDTYDDDITYTSEECVKCELWRDGWTDKWSDGEDGDPWPEQNTGREPNGG